MSSSHPWQPLIIAGLPRCGTTLLSTFLAAQPSCTFVTDYLGAFSDAARRLEVSWSALLSDTQRRVALAMVRDELLRFRHPVLVRADQFTTIAELHAAVLAELAKPGDRVVGHKLVADEREVAALLAHTACHVVVLYRDPRDAALSWFHRTGGGVEEYVERWRRMVGFLQATAHPRLFGVRYEAMAEHPASALGALFDALHLPLELDRGLVFRGPRGPLPWTDNASVQDLRAPFDPAAVGRWRSQHRSRIVRYTAAVTAREVERLGYPRGPELGVRERARWHTHRQTYVALHSADAWWKRGRARLLARLAPPLAHD